MRLTTRVKLCLLSLPLLLLLAACRREVPTPQALPTVTPAPSMTPLPTRDATAVPTPTEVAGIERTGVITTTVQSGDTVFQIARRYNLNPRSIVWANPAITVDPGRISPGQVLTIPPVDGVYHEVQPGETAAEIAAQYDVAPEALINPWNDLEPGDEPRPGQWLVVPGGTGPDFAWSPEPAEPTATPDP